jgi:hypothetical protein
MFLPGLRIQTLKFDVSVDKDLSEQGRNNLDYYLEAPSGETSFVTPGSDISHKFHGHGVNGMWFLRVIPSPHFYRDNEASSAFVHDWTLNFAQTDQVTPVVSYGTVSTIVGNGKKSNSTAAAATRSRSGQSALASMGGRSWAVTFRNKQDTLFYSNAMDQNFIGQWHPPKKSKSVSDDTTKTEPRASKQATIEHIKTTVATPMVMDFAPESDDLYVACYTGPYVARLTAESGYTKQSNLLRKKLKGPMAARFGQHSPTKLYVADTKQHRILEYDIQSGQTRTVAGIRGKKGFQGDGDDATRARLNYPIDMDVDEHGVLVIADGMNNRLRAVNMDASRPHIIGGVTIMPGRIQTIAGSNAPDLKARSPMDTHPRTTYDFATEEQGIRAQDAHINWPFCPRIDSHGRIWFFDADNHRLRIVDRTGLIYTVGGNAGPSQVGFRHVGAAPSGVGNGKSALQTDFNRVMDISVRQVAFGMYDIYLGDTDNCMVRKISGLKFIEHDAESYLDRRTTDLRVTALKDVGLVQRSVEGQSSTTYVGMVSYIKNFGNMPAPGEALGAVNVLYTLETLDGQIVSAGNKGPVFLSNSKENDTQFYDDGVRFPHTQKFSATRPGGVDIYPVSSNANTPIDHVPDDIYVYTQRIDPYGHYPYQMFVPRPRQAILVLSTSSKNGRRHVTQLSPYDLTQKRLTELQSSTKGSSVDPLPVRVGLPTSSSSSSSSSSSPTPPFPDSGSTSKQNDIHPRRDNNGNRTPAYSFRILAIFVIVLSLLLIFTVMRTHQSTAKQAPQYFSSSTPNVYRHS